MNTTNHKTDIRNWKVVTYPGKELHLTVMTEDGERIVTRWNSYRAANKVAKKLGGVAVTE